MFWIVNMWTTELFLYNFYVLYFKIGVAISGFFSKFPPLNFRLNINFAINLINYDTTKMPFYL